MFCFFHFHAQVLKDNVKMTKELARLTGQPLERVERDLGRDFYLAGPEAVSYGVIDEVLKPHDVSGLPVTVQCLYVKTVCAV